MMSGTEAIIASPFPGKEPAPNKGNKCRVWHQTKAVEGSQQGDFGNGELEKPPRMIMGKTGGRSELLGLRNHLLDLSLEFPSWSRKRSKNGDFPQFWVK